jgi:hypothetical protein
VLQLGRIHRGCSLRGECGGAICGECALGRGQVVLEEEVISVRRSVLEQGENAWVVVLVSHATDAPKNRAAHKVISI